MINASTSNNQQTPTSMPNQAPVANTQASEYSSTTTTTSSMKPKRKFSLPIIAGGILLIMLVVASIVGVYFLNNRDQSLYNQSDASGASCTWCAAQPQCPHTPESGGNVSVCADGNLPCCTGWNPGGSTGGGGGSTTPPPAAAKCDSDPVTAVACRGEDVGDVINNYCQCQRTSGTRCACVPLQPVGDNQSCTADQNCQSGFCKKNAGSAAGICRPASERGSGTGGTCSATNRGACTCTPTNFNGTCPSGESCTDGSCQATQVPPGGDCSIDANCGSGRACVGGTCLLTCSGDNLSCTASAQVCAQNGGSPQTNLYCGGGQTCCESTGTGGTNACNDGKNKVGDKYCKEGITNKTFQCATVNGLEYSTDCGSNEICQNGACVNNPSSNNNLCPTDSEPINGGVDAGACKCSNGAVVERGGFCTCTAATVGQCIGDNRCYEITSGIYGLRPETSCGADISTISCYKEGSCVKSTFTTTSCPSGYTTTKPASCTTNTYKNCYDQYCQASTAVPVNQSCPASHPFPTKPSSCASTGGTTPNPGQGNVCINWDHADDTVARWVMFTCDKCAYTTGSDGVEAWRCESNPTYHTTKPSLNGQCGQVDQLTGADGNTFCGIEEINCDGSCRGTTTTPPTTTPPATGPQCLSITMSPVTPKLNDTVTFTCGTVPNVTQYAFRVQLPDGTIQTLGSNPGTPNVSANFTISAAGTYKAQCTICPNGQCYDFEPLGNGSAN